MRTSTIIFALAAGALATEGHEHSHETLTLTTVRPHHLLYQQSLTSELLCKMLIMPLYRRPSLQSPPARQPVPTSSIILHPQSSTFQLPPQQLISLQPLSRSIRSILQPSVRHMPMLMMISLLLLSITTRLLLRSLQPA